MILLSLIEILPGLMALSIPLLAIGGGYYIRLKKIQYGQGFTNKEKETLDKISQENEELKKRVENLEGIITSMDKEILSLKAFDDSLDVQKQVEDLAREMKKKST